MPLKGVFTRIHSTILHHLFSTGTCPVGKNGDMFETLYINAELGLGSYNNYALDENQAKMNQFTSTLASAQKKLQNFGKSLYIYIPSSKADFHKENIPDKYKNMSPESYVRVVDTFREQISQTDVPYLICSDMKGELEYPAFYTTGIHWSRTFEQKVTARVISDIAEITGKTYRNLIFDGVETRSEPFWRDSDLFDLQNTLGSRNCTYYQYNVTPESPDQCDTIRWLIYGDSFGQGLPKDITACYPLEELYYINYDNYISHSDGTVVQLNHSWENLDLNHYLSLTDVVVIEVVEPHLVNYTLGFVDYLNTFLDTYAPQTTETQYAANIDASSDETWPKQSLFGVQGQEVLMNGTVVTEAIRTPEVTQAVFTVSQHKTIREEMVRRQKQLARQGGVVMDGRDIGTEVMPHAKVKIFMTASVEERAKRRYEENRRKGFSSDLEVLKTEIAARDKAGSEREISPLRKAADAVELDTSHRSIDEVVEEVLRIVEKMKNEFED